MGVRKTGKTEEKNELKESKQKAHLACSTSSLSWYLIIALNPVIWLCVKKVLRSAARWRLCAASILFRVPSFISASSSKCLASAARRSKNRAVAVVRTVCRWAVQASLAVCDAAEVWSMLSGSVSSLAGSGWVEAWG